MSHPLLSCRSCKLEALDRKNPTLICVASIADVNLSRSDCFLIHFDGWSDTFGDSFLSSPQPRQLRLLVRAWFLRHSSYWLLCVPEPRASPRVPTTVRWQLRLVPLSLCHRLSGRASFFAHCCMQQNPSWFLCCCCRFESSSCSCDTKTRSWRNDGGEM
jgi:hypothetical protein